MGYQGARERKQPVETPFDVLRRNGVRVRTVREPDGSMTLTPDLGPAAETMPRVELQRKLDLFEEKLPMRQDYYRPRRFPDVGNRREERELG